jgi:hypothetical protein
MTMLTPEELRVKEAKAEPERATMERDLYLPPSEACSWVIADEIVRNDPPVEALEVLLADREARTVTPSGGLLPAGQAYIVGEGPTAPTLAEAREAARQLAGLAAGVVHRFRSSTVRAMIGL